MYSIKRQSTVVIENHAKQDNTIHDLQTAFGNKNQNSNEKQTDKQQQYYSDKKSQFSTNKKQNDVNQKELISLGKKEYLQRISILQDFIKSMISIEQSYSKALSEVGKPQFLKNSYNDTMVKIDEQYVKKRQHSFNIKELDKKDQVIVQSLIYKNYKSQAENKVVLPNWKVFKAAINTCSKNHSQCASYLQKGSLDFCIILQQDYLEDYVQQKKFKKKSQIEYQKLEQEYKQSKIKFEEVEKTLTQKVKSYKDQEKNSQTGDIIIQLQNEIHTLKYNFQTLRNQTQNLANRKSEKLKEFNDINRELAQFKNKWQKQLVKLVKTVLRGILQSYNELVCDVSKIYEELLNYQFILEEKEIMAQIEKGNLSQKGTSRHVRASSDMTISDFNLNQMTSSQNIVNFNEDPFFMGSDEEQEDISSFGINQNDNDASLMNNIQNVIEQYNQKLNIIKDKSVKQQEIIVNYIKYNTEVQITLDEMYAASDNYSQNLNQKILLEQTLSKNDLWQKNFLQKLANTVHEGIGQNKQIIKVFCSQILKSIEEVKSLKKELDEISINNKKQIEYYKKQVILSISNFQKDIKTLRVDQIKHRFQSFQRENQSSFRNLSKYLDNYEKLIQTQKITTNLVKKNVLLYLLQMVEQQKEHMRSVLIQTDSGLNEEMDESINILEQSIVSVHGNENYQNNDYMENSLYQNSLKPIGLNKQQSIDFTDINLIRNHGEQEKQLVDDKYQKRLSMEWISRLVGVFFSEWKQNDYFKDKIKKTLWKSFNKKLPDFLQEIQVKNLTIKGDPPTFKEIELLKSENFEFLGELDLEFKGTIVLEIQTAIHVNWPRKDFKIYKVSVEAIIKQLNGRIRLCFVPRSQGKSWFSFVGEPAVYIDINPQLGSQKSQIMSKVPQVSSILKELIITKIKKMTYPNRVSTPIPMSKKSKKMEEIKKQIKNKIDDLNQEDDNNIQSFQTDKQSFLSNRNLN